jgi:hypothetical protein
MADALAIVLLPGRLETFEHQAQAKSLLAIPRVIALEPSRVRTPRFLREGTVARQAARIQLPGELRAVILYHPAQYPLARALLGRHQRSELWYVAPDLDTIDGDELLTFDQLARERAAGILLLVQGVDDEPLRVRLQELEVISPRAFLPSARFARTFTGKGSRDRR